MKIKKFVLCSVILLLLIACSSMVKPSKINRISIETELADLNVDFYASSVVVSPDVRNIAYVEDSGWGLRVVVNHILHENFDNIGTSTPIFSPNNEFVAYFAYYGGSSGGAFGLFARNPYWEVVVDTIEYGIYFEGMLDNSLVISPDGEHVAYAISTGSGNSFDLIIDNEGVPWVVADEDSNLTEDDIAILRYFGTDFSVPFVYSPDSKRLAIVFGYNSKRVVVDSKAGKLYDYILVGTPVFSPDSKKIAYGAVEGDDYFIVVDGEEGDIYENIAGETLTFSPDSKHLAYAALKNSDWLVVRDEVESIAYDNIGQIVFSPDSKHLAYTAKDDEDWIVVLDEKEITRHSGILEETLSFSPNSKSFVYAAQVDSGVVVFEDGKPSETYEAIAITPTYSPNGKYLAYTIEENKTQSVVINGVKGQSYPAVMSHNGGRIVFDNDHHIHYLVIKDDNKIYLIEESF